MIRYQSRDAYDASETGSSGSADRMLKSDGAGFQHISRSSAQRPCSRAMKRYVPDVNQEVRSALLRMASASRTRCMDGGRRSSGWRRGSPISTPTGRARSGATRLATLGERHTVVRYDERGCGSRIRKLAISRSILGWPSRDSRRCGRVGSLHIGRRVARSRGRRGLCGRPSRASHRSRPLQRLRARPQASRPEQGRGRGDRGDPSRLRIRLTRRSAAYSARCSFRMARPSRWRGTRSCSGAPPRPRPRYG